MERAEPVREGEGLAQMFFCGAQDHEMDPIVAASSMDVVRKLCLDDDEQEFASQPCHENHKHTLTTRVCPASLSQRTCAYQWTITGATWGVGVWSTEISRSEKKDVSIMT